jgi:hypothetical protein
VLGAEEVPAVTDLFAPKASDSSLISSGVNSTRNSRSSSMSMMNFS